MLLSLDVGFTDMGWVVFHKGQIKDCGVIKTEKTKKKSTRVADDHAYRSTVLAEGIDIIIDEYEIKGIIGELPSGGAQNATALGKMMSAISVVSSVGQLGGLPMEWATPTEVKKAMTGLRSASKEAMMAEAAKRFGFEIKGTTFSSDGRKFGKGQFGHIADAIGVYIALKNDNLVKMFG